MSTHPCHTCGHVHDAPPAVDWTGYVESARATAARIDLSPEQVRRLRAIFATGRRRPQRRIA
jgi:hypothetical protein